MENLIHLTIDNRPVSVPQGTSVLDAAATVGIDIPALCHIDLKGTCVKSSPAACRISVVEIEGPMTFGQIKLLNNATAESDYVVASVPSVPKDLNNLNLSKNSSFHIRHYHIPNPYNSPIMVIWDHAH